MMLGGGLCSNSEEEGGAIAVAIALLDTNWGTGANARYCRDDEGYDIDINDGGGATRVVIDGRELAWGLVHAILRHIG